MQYETDELLVHLCRAQQLSQSITQAFDRRKAVPADNRIPQAAFIQGLQERVRGFVAALPPHIKTDRTYLSLAHSRYHHHHPLLTYPPPRAGSLEGHFFVAEIMIYENSVEELCQRPFHHRPGEQTGGPSAPMAPPSGELDGERVRILWESVRLVDGFMTKRYNRAIDDYPRYVCLTSFDLTYVFLTMLKLSTMQVPGLDLARVREELHVQGR
jgi:hypothetical protein